MIIQEEQKIALPKPAGDIKQLEANIRSLKGGFDLVFDFIEDFEQGKKDDLNKKREAIDKIKSACISHGVDKKQLVDLNINCSREFYDELEKNSTLKIMSERELYKKSPEDLKGILLSIARAIIKSGSKSFGKQFLESLSKVAADKIIDITEDKIVEAVLGNEAKQYFQKLKEIVDGVTKIKELADK